MKQEHIESHLAYWKARFSEHLNEVGVSALRTSPAAKEKAEKIIAIIIDLKKKLAALK